MSTQDMTTRTMPQHQTFWDWRAASNFMFGGTGTGLLLFAALNSATGGAFRQYAIVGALLVALGLGCVSLEIGRPLRSMNVFKHLKTSWMTREAVAAIFLFGAAAYAVWSGSRAWIWLAAAFGMLFLYCQARILTASKGIPAWRAASLAPLIIMTGITEGAAMMAIIRALAGVGPLATWAKWALLLALLERAILWYGYRKELAKQGAPAPTLRILDMIQPFFIRVGHWAAAALVAASFAVPESEIAPWLCAMGGVFAVVNGWFFKYTLVARAAYNQGYAMPQVPVRGRAPAKP
jgi:phenylacetyl-CoA:acceptor oxidoreductase subunit 2